jgi:hypothetical protein
MTVLMLLFLLLVLVLVLVDMTNDKINASKQMMITKSTKKTIIF